VAVAVTVGLAVLVGGGEGSGGCDHGRDGGVVEEGGGEGGREAGRKGGHEGIVRGVLIFE
jgi:hypothetical protein